MEQPIISAFYMNVDDSFSMILVDLKSTYAQRKMEILRIESFFSMISAWFAVKSSLLLLTPPLSTLHSYLLFFPLHRFIKLLFRITCGRMFGCCAVEEEVHVVDVHQRLTVTLLEIECRRNYLEKLGEKTEHV